MSTWFGPKGFEILKSSPKLYYRVEDDGGVLITGVPEKAVFNKKIKEGTLSGGIKMTGGTPLLFGDLHAKNRRYPLRWVDLGVAEDMPPPRERRNKPGEHPWKAERRRIEKAREDREHHDHDAKVNRDRWVPKAAYERLEAECKALREANTKAFKKVDELRTAANQEVANIRKDYLKRVQERHVHLEATLTGSDQVEGHKTEHWEVGDKRYLVIAETPSGLARGNWAEDISKALNRMAGLEEVAVAIVPPGARVRVVELIPLDTEEEDDLDEGQF